MHVVRERRGFIAVSALAWFLPSRTMKRRAWPIAVGLLYILLVGVCGGLRADHVFIGLLGLLDAWNEKTRLFLARFFPFILTGVIYDAMRYFYWPAIEGRVHVVEPYQLDRSWFPVAGLTANEWFDVHRSTVLDLLCGFAYLVYVGEYLAVAFLLFFRRRFDVLRTFALAFLIVNVLGFVTYFIYPAAPPWYVSAYGFGPARMDVHSTAAAASRFDALLGTHFFGSMYGRGVDVYGAYPSLHVAYPLLAAWAVFRVPELRWARIPALLFCALMALSAVYLQHHYVVDVLLGYAYAVATIAILQWSAARASSIQPAPSGSPPAAAPVASCSARE